MNTLFEATSAKDIYDKYYTDEFPEKVYIRILMMDPTAKNVDSQDQVQIKKGKYTDWLVKQFLNKTDDDKLLMLNEDAEAIYEALQLFNKLTNTKVGTENLQKLTAEYEIHVKDFKDINSYSTNELRLLSSAYEQSKTSLAVPASEKEKDVEIIYEDGLYKVLIPQTHEAARKYGTGTSWCTATSNGQWFTKYTKTNREHGPLCIIIDKTATPPNNKWQYHKASGQFMDYQDHRISQFMFISRQVRKGPKYEDSIDFVAEAIERRFDDPAWDYENISDEASVTHDIQQALGDSSDKRISDRIVNRLISEQELNPAIVAMLVNDYDFVFTFEHVENILTEGVVDVPTLDAVITNMGWNKSNILSRYLSNQSRYTSKDVDWTNSYLLEYFTSDLTPQNATKLLGKLTRKLLANNLLSSLANTSIDELMSTLLLISASQLQEARRALKTIAPEEVLRKGIETATSVSPIEELKQLLFDRVHVYPKTEKVLQNILNVDDLFTLHPLWSTTELLKLEERKALIFKVSKAGWKTLYATGTPVSPPYCISQSEAALAIALHLNSDLTKSADSDDRWATLVQHGLLQNVNDKLAGSSIVVYLLLLFNVHEYDPSVIPTILKSLSGGITVGNAVYFYNKLPSLKLSDVTSDEATLSTESSDFNKTVAEVFQEKYTSGYTSNRSVSKALCLLSRSPLIDIQCPFDRKQPDAVVGTEASLPLRDAIVTLQNRRRTK